MVLGNPAVVIWPLVVQNAGEGLPLLSYGLPMLSLKLTRLNRLKNSARNCKCWLSVNLKFFWREKSTVAAPGEVSTFRPPFPKWPGSYSASPGAQTGMFRARAFAMEPTRAGIAVQNDGMYWVASK